MRSLLFALVTIAPVAALAPEVGTVLTQPPLAEHAAAIPRVAAKDAAAQAINARLQQLDDGAAEVDWSALLPETLLQTDAKDCARNTPLSHRP